MRVEPTTVSILQIGVVGGHALKSFERGTTVVLVAQLREPSARKESMV